jgi:hypothetical protein
MAAATSTEKLKRIATGAVSMIGNRWSVFTYIELSVVISIGTRTIGVISKIYCPLLGLSGDVQRGD